ncbi:hypothetical protein [Methanobacterium spitsbergense]|uniref:Uncharacterized protein n=1 Tax=Methanobacterium spitsbergense TaxID=2874285 RepID=A0A8T5UST5_9EURY|nr:hypothetical protein [Methanobacterium spitsbergense]MBZ2166754.1 hypothetical protein [Methanobacterium spitsbergense]
MKNGMVLIIVFISVIILLVGSASAATSVNSISTQKIVKNTDNNVLYSTPVTHSVSNVKSTVKKSVSTTAKYRLINSGANKIYWKERGGIFSYSWKTYQSTQGSIIVNVHYKTKTNSWNGKYSITKVSKNRLKIVNTSPEVKFYSGHPSETSYVSTNLTPAKYYWRIALGLINNGGYF